MTAVFLVPLVALLVLRYLDGRDTGRAGSRVRLGVVLAVAALVLDRAAVSLDARARSSRSPSATGSIRRVGPASGRSSLPLAAACGLAVLLDGAARSSTRCAASESHRSTRRACTSPIC